MTQEENRQKSSPLAVALSHQKGTEKAPVITATGRGAVAEQILNIAFENGVAVREDADLAQILAEVDVDTPIPLEAFAAVSEILGYLYRAQNDPSPPPTFNAAEVESLDDTNQ